MTPRLGVLGLWHETNTFSSAVTGLQEFEHFELASGEDLRRRNHDAATVIGGFLRAPGIDAVPLFAAGAWPSGPASAEVLAQLLTRLADALRSAGPLDGVLVNLHGAMVAEGTDDVELAVLDVIRETVGAIPVGAVLDLHANPSPELVAATDVLVSYDTFPHVDMYERGLEVAELLRQVVTEAPLRTSLRKIPLLVSPIAQSTDSGPLASVQHRARELAAASGLSRVCVVGGFAYSDVDRAGMSLMATYRPDMQEVADDVLGELVREVRDRAPEFTVAREGVQEAVARAVASPVRPVFLVDVADNVGGGSPGDGTALLAELLRVGATGAIVTIADRDVARLAESVGEGGEVDAWVGGKTDTHHGDPVHVRGRVRRITDGTYRSGGYYMRGQTFSMGTTAVIDVEGVSLVVTERPTPPFHSEQLTSVGLRPEQAAVVVMKGALAWRGAYPGVPAEIIEVATPGICPVDVGSLPRRTVPMEL